MLATDGVTEEEEEEEEAEEEAEDKRKGSGSDGVFGNSSEDFLWIVGRRRVLSFFADLFRRAMIWRFLNIFLHTHHPKIARGSVFGFRPGRANALADLQVATVALSDHLGPSLGVSVSGWFCRPCRR